MDEELKQYLDTQFTAMRADVSEQVHGMETHLLKEFRKYAVRIEAQLRVDRAYLTGFDQRIGVAESRLNDLDEAT